MGKKKKDKQKKNLSKVQELRLSELKQSKCKTKCCDKFKKGEHKRCKKCPCFDLLKKAA